MIYINDICIPNSIVNTYKVVAKLWTMIIIDDSICGVFLYMIDDMNTMNCYVNNNNIMPLFL